MINLKWFKKMYFVIIMFTLIIFTFSITASIVIAKYKNENQLYGMQNKHTRYLKINTSNKLLIKDILNVLEEFKDANVYLEYDPISKYMRKTTIFGKGIYYNYEVDNKLPILEGKNFTLNDINSTDKKILVGKNLINEIIKEGDEQFFVIEDEKYKVVGILGDNNKETGYDNTFVINLNSTNMILDSTSICKLNVENKKDLQKIENKYTKLAELNGGKVDDSEENNEKLNLKEIIDDNKAFMDMAKIIFVFGILNTIVVVYYWMNKNIKDIGVRKAYGATDFKIVLYILKQYQIGILISSFLGVGAHIVFQAILKSMFPKFSFELYFVNIIIIIAIFSFIGLIVSVIPIVRAIKVQPVIIMKGKLK